jgi:hypothetical protein
MKRKHILSLALMALLSTASASAQIISPSFEWLTVKSDRIVRGFITDYTQGKDAAGKEIYFCSFQFHEMMKGPQERNFVFACYDMPADSLKKYRDIRVEVLIVFENLAAPLTHDGKAVTIKPLQAYEAPAILNLTNPQGIFFSAFDFTIMKHKTLILDLCRIIITQTAQHATGNLSGKMLYQAVPEESEVYLRAGEGKKLFLEVPAFLFPDAAKKPK